MALYHDEGVVLRTAKLGEADRIITLLTRDHGKVRAVAKGVRRAKSRFGGRLEPFMRVDVLIAEGRTLDTLMPGRSAPTTTPMPRPTSSPRPRTSSHRPTTSVSPRNTVCLPER